MDCEVMNTRCQVLAWDKFIITEPVAKERRKGGEIELEGGMEVNNEEWK